MKAFAVYALLLGLLSTFAFSGDVGSRQAHDDSRSVALAVNFGVFRNAAWRYARENPNFSGLVLVSNLSVPTEWSAARSWTARMEGGVCYVYGAASASEIPVVLREFRNSQAIGQNVMSKLEPGAIPLPAFIPAGNLVSLMRVK